MMTLGDILDQHPEVLDLVRCVGVKYWYGEGQPSTPWPPKRVDCSGWVLMSWVRLGLLPATERDHGAMDIANTMCVETKEPRLGDVAIYPGHVMLCLDAELVIGASGGDHTTHGDKPSACVQMHHFHYRTDFVCFARLRALP